MSPRRCDDVLVSPLLPVLGLVGLALTAILLIGADAVTGQSPPGGPLQILEDFSKAEPDGFPQGWQASRSEALTRKAYVVFREGDQAYLRTKGIDGRMRIFRKMSWEPKAYPIVTWRWRLRTPATGTEPLAALFVSLDEDFFGIPVNTKYTWSPNLAKGALVEGGFFRPAQLVLRNHTDKVGEWLDERVNAYEDFKRIHKHDPAPQAWGISFVTGPDVELDLDSIALARQ